MSSTTPVARTAPTGPPTLRAGRDPGGGRGGGRQPPPGRGRPPEGALSGGPPRVDPLAFEGVAPGVPPAGDAVLAYAAADRRERAASLVLFA
jgi:hypothetical protein